jgi:2-methylaconitate cis-trans-isomerase PrpF
VISKAGKTIGIACTVAAAFAVALVPGAAAKGGDGVRVAGTCSGATSSELKVKHDDGRLEVEFEVDQNRNGVRWAVQLRKDGRLVFQGARRTTGPSGSFSIERHVVNGTATATIRARASRAGEVCSAQARI